MLWVVAALLAIAVFAVGTPFVLQVASHVDSNSWGRFSDVGQAYGGVAGVVSIVALVGVIISLILQSRQTAADLELAQRTIHADLLAKAVDDPELRACWGSSIRGELDKQHFYSNSIVSFWASMFEIGKIGEDELRLLAGSMFSGAAGRRYWSVAAPLRRLSYGSGKRDRRFTEILDEEYLRASDAVKGSPPAPTSQAIESEFGNSAIRMLVIGFFGGVLLSAISAALRRSYRLFR